MFDSPSALYPGVSQYNGRHWLKRAMRRRYGVDYIHAWVGFRLGGKELVYHSTGMGVHVVGLKKFLVEREIKHCWEIEIDPDVFSKFADEAFWETGKSYSNWQLLGSAVAILLHLKKLPFGANGDNEHVCSETALTAVTKYTIASRMHDWSKKDQDRFTPVDVVDTCRWVEARGAARVVA